MNVEFHPNAQAEFEEYVRFYESKAAGLGSRFIDEVERASSLLSSHPEIGRVIENEYRHFVLAEFPHSFIYSIAPESIWIIAVAHHKEARVTGTTELSANNGIKRSDRAPFIF